MNKRRIIKYIDLIVKSIEDYEMFSVNNIVFELLKPETKEQKEAFHEFIDQIKLFGRNNDLFVAKTIDGWCRLTEKGKRLKKSGKSYKSFTKSENRNKWYNENWIGYAIAFLVFLFSVYQYVSNRALRTENEKINAQYLIYRDSTQRLQKKFEEQMLRYNVELKGTKDSETFRALPNSDFAIIPFNEEWHWIFKDGKATDLSIKELNDLESIIQKTINQHNDKASARWKLNPEGYKRQYIAILNESGEKEVWINFFCETFWTEEQWRNHPNEVDDGGTCFFNLKVNLNKRTSSDLRINSLG